MPRKLSEERVHALPLLKLHVAPDLLAAIEAAAKSAGKNRTAWLRSVLADASADQKNS